MNPEEVSQGVDIMSQLVTVAPVVAVLIYFIYYFRGELKKKDKIILAKEDEIKVLNDKIHDMGIESISVIKDLNPTLREYLHEIKKR